MVTKAHKQIMVRLYDEELLQKLTAEYEGNGRKYKTQNDFFVAMLRKGVADEKSKMVSLMEKQNKQNDELTALIKTSIKGNAINSIVTKNILSEVYNLLFLSADYDTQTELLSGNFDYIDDKFFLAELNAMLEINKREGKG